MLEYKGYLGRVAYDDEAGIFHGEVINLRDVITFQGETVQELRRAFQDSVDDYLGFCADRGEEPERPYSGTFTVRVTPELHRDAALQARLKQKSLNSWVAELLAEATAARSYAAPAQSRRMAQPVAAAMQVGETRREYSVIKAPNPLRAYIDTVEMKRRIQEKIYEETQGMKPDEFVAYIHRQVQESRFAAFFAGPHSATTSSGLNTSLPLAAPLPMAETEAEYTATPADRGQGDRSEGG